MTASDAARGASGTGSGAAERGGGGRGHRRSMVAGRRGPDEHLVSLVAPGSFAAEQYRALRHAVELRRQATGLQVVAVTSAVGGDGKTTTTINLAVALARAPEARVLVIDADLRRAAMAERLARGAARLPGLVDAVLDGRDTLDGLIQPGPVPNLSVLSAGRSTAAPYEALKSPRLQTLFEEARRRYDWIVLDTPPLVIVPDARLVERWVDGLLVVVAAHRTPRVLVAEALNAIDPAKVIGVVFNGVDSRSFRYYRRFYGTYYAGSGGPEGPEAGRWRHAVRRALGAPGRSPNGRASR